MRRRSSTGASGLAGSEKNARREGRLIVFVDDSGVLERPTRIKTWGIRGETPVVQFHFDWYSSR